MIHMFGGSAPTPAPPPGDPYLFHPSLYTCKYSTQYGHYNCRCHTHDCHNIHIKAQYNFITISLSMLTLLPPPSHPPPPPYHLT